jgi:hypothetical protein
MESRRTLQEEEKAARARCPPKISGGASKAARQRAGEYGVQIPLLDVLLPLLQPRLVNVLE